MKPTYVNMWKDRTVYIVGGGPSLKNFDWSQLDDKRVIAINRAYEKLPRAQVLFWMDDAFFEEHWKGLHVHRARYKMVVSPLFKFTDRSRAMNVTKLQWAGIDGFSKFSNQVYTGKNSGYAAINLAYHFGVNKIVLLGYDMREVDGQSHWHNGYTYNYRSRKLIEYKKWFHNIAGPLKEHNVEVVNACPDSLLECFPKTTLEEVLIEKVNS